MRSRSTLLLWFPLWVLAPVAACEPRDTVALEVRAVAQTAQLREPMYLLTCRGGDPLAHYKWTLPAGLRAVPGIVDAPTLLVQSRPHPGVLEATCAIEQEGQKPRTATGSVPP